MGDVVRAFLDVLPARRNRAATGWINFSCPVCGDGGGKKMRCGFLETPTGGFRLRCFNGGCALNENPTGWEPGSGLGGRPRQVFAKLGGDVRDLPIADLLRSANRYDLGGRKVEEGTEEAIRHFPSIEMPPGTLWMHEVADDDPVFSDPNFRDAVAYIGSRGEEILANHIYGWSPAHPRFVLVPYLHHDRIVGYMGRSVDPGKARYIGRAPADYVFNQHRLEYGRKRAAIIVEGVFDAIAIGALASRNSKLTKKQELLLNLSGCETIALPDMKPGEGDAFIEAAERNGWKISMPRWDRGVKDVCDAVAKYGMLYTVESIVAGASRNYVAARVSLNLR
jgi:hypothetical protein